MQYYFRFGLNRYNKFDVRTNPSAGEVEIKEISICGGPILDEIKCIVDQYKDDYDLIYMNVDESNELYNNYLEIGKKGKDDTIIFYERKGN